MSNGKAIRLSRLLHEDRALVSIPMDHAIAHGVAPRLRDIKSRVAAVVAGHPDAVTLHKGLAASVFPEFARETSLILKCSSFSALDSNYDVHVATVEEAVRLGADAVAAGVIIGDDRQADMVSKFAKLSERADAWGMPLIGHIYPRGDRIPREDRSSVQWVSYCTRLGAELGADIIKTTYTGSSESFADVVDATPAHVVVQGGADAPNDEAYLRRAAEVVEAGAAGVAFGSYVWGHSDPAALVTALRLVIHDRFSVEEAMEEAGLLPVEAIRA